jgi:SAM-dependent methyltransferase
MTDIGVIPNLKNYNAAMERSVIDKIYFMDKIFGADTVVDFGCADGTLIATLHRLFPDVRYAGFDISQEMLDAAREKVPEGTLLTSDWNEILEFIEGRSAALVLSSVIHEVYSYGSANDVEEFWKRVWNGGFEYVAMRELAVSKTASRPSDPIAVARIRQIENPERISQWEARWGSLSENWSLVKFCLTYRYVENWEREMRENYLPLSVEELLALAPGNYFPTHFEHYTLPFLRRSVERDFGFSLSERTHAKIIFEKRQTATATSKRR